MLNDLADLDDLDDSVTAVESDPSRYNLTNEEVRRRRGFVDQIKDQIEDLRDATTKASDSSQVSVKKYIAHSLDTVAKTVIPGWLLKGLSFGGLQ